MNKEHIELENSASGIVASGNVTVNCRNIILYHNSKVKGHDVEITETAPEANRDASGNYKICDGCKEPITGFILEAMGKAWHAEHFVCFHCKKQIYIKTNSGSGRCDYYPIKGKPYCKEDFGKLFCAVCAACNETIFDEVYNAMGRTWHTKHFVCTYCKIELDGQEHFIYNDKPYCENDFYNLFGEKCAGCGKTIKRGGLTAMNKQWHMDCFVCTVCRIPVKTSFFTYENRPYCHFHYNQIKK